MVDPAKTIRNLTYIMDSKGVSTTLLFSSSKLTKPALEEISLAKNFRKNFIVIYLEDLIQLDTEPSHFLENKINELFD